MAPTRGGIFYIVCEVFNFNILIGGEILLKESFFLLIEIGKWVGAMCFAMISPIVEFAIEEPRKFFILLALASIGGLATQIKQSK